MLLSIIIPVYNEAEGLPTLMARLLPVMRGVNCDYELIFVNDGSTDETGRILADLADDDDRVKLLCFTRNFGHQAAITAGLDFADGDAAVVMDADLQDPPEILPEMLRLWDQGYDVVSAQRQARPGDGFLKRSTASAFYWFMRRFVDQRLTPEVGDFLLFIRTSVLALPNFREQHRCMRGLDGPQRSNYSDSTGRTRPWHHQVPAVQNIATGVDCHQFVLRIASAHQHECGFSGDVIRLWVFALQYFCSPDRQNCLYPDGPRWCASRSSSRDRSLWQWGRSGTMLLGSSKNPSGGRSMLSRTWPLPRCAANCQSAV